MAGRLVRAGGSMLAAPTIAAGGAVTGVGTAGAAGSGSADGGSVALGSSAHPCTGEDTMPGCDDGQFKEVATVGHIQLEYIGSSKPVVLGQETGFLTRFDGRDAVITSVTHHPPRGFEFTSAKDWSWSYPAGDGVVTYLDSTAVVDPVTGDVTVTAPAGGWTAAPGRYSGSVFVSLGYRATAFGQDGASGLRFTGTDVPASEGWMVTGTTKVTLMDLGSSF
ncbi:hypothetical protein FK531_01280 [Rhodococcus spelaei]|uniref:Uncharacterized protein n=1 Tax=Rhodococcus spelaei TaxID=2546320 RepID=A0A541BR46_9NOCA|nr:hypothetical protein [Rhodococcus spelaei]TQF74756.1 hypothetical protein FK531_01280 [Rhodococcus spelaei]